MADISKIMGIPLYTPEVENWVDYLNQNLWSTGQDLATISGSTIWIFGNTTSTQQMNREGSKEWGQMGTPDKVRIKIEKSSTSDSDAALDYIIIRAMDSAGEPQLQTICEYPPSGDITITNAGLELDLDLDWNLGTPPLKLQSIAFQPYDTSGYDLKVTKVQFLNANDPISYINSNPRFRHINLSTEWTISGANNMTYETAREGFIKIAPPAIMDPPGQWQIGYVYSVGSTTTVYPGVRYVCIQAHTSAAINEPGTGAQWPNYWVVEYFYLVASGGWNVGFRPTELVIAIQFDADNYGTGNYYIVVQDVDGNTLTSNTLSYSTSTGIYVTTLWPNFSTYDKDLYRLRFQAAGGSGHPDYIRIRSTGFWYNE